MSGSGALTLPALWDPWEWVVLCHMARIGPKTRHNHRAGLRRWVQWCSDHQIEPLEALEAHIELWMRSLDESDGLGPSTIGGYLGALSGVYRMAHRHGLRPDNPTQYIRRPRVSRVSSTESVTREEAARLLAASWDGRPVITAAVHLWLLNGTRFGETLAIDIEEIGRHGDLPTIHLPRRKGGVPGDIALADETWQAVQKAQGGRSSGPLLLGPRGVRVSAPTLRRDFRQVLTGAGIGRRITPHGLRHTFVTLALDAKCAERDIMASTGHHDPKMIVFYDRSRAAVERNVTHQVAAYIADADVSGASA